MNPVNATALYISASRLVLNYDPEDPKAFTEIIRILPYLRQSLSCCVCGHLLQDPIASTNSTCQHYVCKTCKGKKMMIKPSCSWCKDYEQYEENKQLSILVNCYKKLCEYITQITLVQDIREGVDYYSDMLALLREGSLFFEETEKSSDSSFTLCLTHSPVLTTLEPIADPQANLSPKDESALNTATGSSVVNGLPTCNGLPIDRFAINIASPEHQNMIEMCNTVDMKTDYLSDSLPHVCDMVTTDLCSTGIDICNFSEDPKPGDSLLLSVEELLHSLETVSITEDGCPNLHPNMEATVFNEPILQLSSQSLSQNVFTSTSPTLHGLSSTAATAKVAKLNRKRSRSESDSDKVQPLPISTIIRDPTLGVSAPVTVKHERKISLQATATVSNGCKTPKISKTVPLSAKSMKKSHEHGSKKSPFKSKSGILKKDKALKGKSFSHHFMAGNPNKSVYKKPQGKKGCKCGRAMQNQSVLTCCSQRCSCYSNRKACLDCRCCGCQNSYMANGKKKLEAFAVPEKALEQSRLTFGVNVTTDSMCNASTRTSAINVIGSPGMTFLAASTHDNKSLNEAIDMRFGC